jgi:hypothetical protein
MGLDQYARVIDQNGEKTEIAYWRKHPNLHGWMEHLWNEKGRPNDTEETSGLGLSNFNCVPLELTSDDLDALEEAITGQTLPETAGFFFGSDSDEYYKDKDLEFIRQARQALAEGKRVEYDSWW